MNDLYKSFFCPLGATQNGSTEDLTVKLHETNIHQLPPVDYTTKIRLLLKYEICWGRVGGNTHPTQSC